MKTAILKGVAALGMAALALGSMAASAGAQSLLERADKGEPIRIGFANEIPFAYPADDGSPKGFVNVFKGTGRVYLSPMPNSANMLRNVVSSSMYAYSSSSS